MLQKTSNRCTSAVLIITATWSIVRPFHRPVLVLCLLSPFIHLSHLSSLFSPHLSPLHYISTPLLLSRTLSSPLTSPLPLRLLRLLVFLSPTSLPPLSSIFPSPPSFLISLVNNSTAVHTWVVIAELHMGDLEDKWTIRMEELKTSPRLHYRAGGICRLPACLPG